MWSSVHRSAVVAARRSRRRAGSAPWLPRSPAAAALLRGPFAGAERSTLAFVRRRGAVLLIEKRRGHGAGRVNAPGGRVEGEESLATCAERETHEEVGLRLLEPRLLGELRFEDANGGRMQVFVHRAAAWLGSPRATAEAVPFWAPEAALPLHRMWPDDVLWLPLLLRGRPFRAGFLTQGPRIHAAAVEPLGWGATALYRAGPAAPAAC